MKFYRLKNHFETFCKKKKTWQRKFFYETAPKSKKSFNVSLPVSNCIDCSERLTFARPWLHLQLDFGNGCPSAVAAAAAIEFNWSWGKSSVHWQYK